MARIQQSERHIDQSTHHMRALLTSVSTLGLVLGAGQAMAQATPAPTTTEPRGIEVITVTAQKRAESLQDVPIAVTAVGQLRLQEANIDSLENLQVLVPNISFGNDFNVAKIFIRGVGTNTSTNGADPAVALYVDGAVIARPEAQFASLFDLERVEVLRGPQGTLFGRNAVGGAISLITAKPKQQFGGYFRNTIGNYEAVLSEGAITGPLGDIASGRIAFRYNKRGGFGKNPVSGSDVDDLNKYMIRASLDLQMTEKLNLALSAERYDQDDNANAIKFKQAAFPTVPTLFPFGVGGFATNPRDLAGEFDNHNENKTWAVTAIFSYELSEKIELKSISNFREFNQQLLQDLDMSGIVNSIDTTGRATTIQNRNPYSKQTSQEFQFNYTGERIKGVLGVYYINEDMGTFPNTIGLTPTSGQRQVGALYAAAGRPTTVNPPRFNTEISQQTVEAWAAFADYTVKLSEQFSLKVGGRYSEEARTLRNKGIIAAAGGRGPLLFTDAYNERDFDNFSPKIGIEFRPAEDNLLYYTYSEGFKSGTGELTISTNGIIEPELAFSHEVGYKTTLFDRRVVFNAAAFYSELAGLQVNRTIFDPAAGFRTIYENAANTIAKGVEADISWLATDRLRLDFAIAYLDSTFDGYITNDPLDPRNVVGSPVFAPANVNLTGKYTRYSPKWTAALYGEYRIPLSSGAEVSLTGDVSYKDTQYHTEFNRPEMSTPAYTMLNGAVAYTTANADWTLQAWIQNATDELVEAGTFNVATSRSIGRTFLPPRTYGLTLGYKF